mmetsp:Transcript_130865/g.406934  ORF Transcript_130865/g.406934 Transcript_130865/m.406934 type:complete len:160 (-) Transcript_130865:92-571(-)
MTIGLVNRGVTCGVHDFREGERTREEYQQLLTSYAGDTRCRLFGADPTTGTFNAQPRAQSLGAPGRNPKGEYQPMRPGLSPEEPLEAPKPKSVTGGHIAHYQSTSFQCERLRRTGSLGRNIVGNSTVKDDRFVYYGGHGGSHYGINSGTRNTRDYRELS